MNLITFLSSGCPFLPDLDQPILEQSNTLCATNQNVTDELSGPSFVQLSTAHQLCCGRGKEEEEEEEEPGLDAENVWFGAHLLQARGGLI